MLAGNNSVNVQESNLTYSQSATNYYGPVTAGTTKINYPVFIPATYEVNNINISDAYKICKELKTANNMYQFMNKIDTHLIKNSEWGAIVYLTHSKYGRNGEEVTINNVNVGGNLWGITGYAGTSISATKVGIADNNYAWNTTNGYRAGTTNNQYGIYDLSGGTWEYTAGYINNGHSNLTSYCAELYNDGGNSNSTEYKSIWQVGGRDTSSDNYNEVSNLARKGEAIWEIDSWFGDFNYCPFSNLMISVRGGSSDDETIAGLFARSGTAGGVISYCGFRTVLICE